ncbi:hypothetical protein LWC34_21545 [Kibdelosporangium philippinense]|uniref:histidine kinase n=1 Tax=Kibdelosporangium philippinense TaxID=211113 RepID=A0ABS8ZBZ2_9PSEU|nr:hypothetical protein [Kibdelosporangium philippinense]MCE7005393.1 hypothetical protein [Kibdelosporangium philippinense]
MRRRELLGRWILPIRLLPLALAFGYLMILHGSLQPTGADWVVTVASTLLIAGQGRWPLPVTLLQAGLVAISAEAQLGQGVATMASLFALGELAWRRGGWQMWIGAVAVAVAGMCRPAIQGMLPEVFAAFITTCLPVLLGMHLRSVQEVAWQAKELSASEAQAARAEERTAIARERVEAAGPDVRAEIDPKVADVDAVVRLAVLRVVQEGLTNVLKHAGPQAKVSLSVIRYDDAVDVSLRNVGPATPEAAEPGHGLIGMRERVELVGGKLVTGPVGMGWRVHAWLPA